MSKKFSPAAVGMFVSGAILILLIGLFALGTGEIFEKRGRFVLYFQSSANGLQEGSDVLLGGVKVGTVERMLIQMDPESGERVIPVIIELSANQIAALSVNDEHTVDNILSRETMDDFVSKGLRGRLKSKSALTGQLFVDLEFFSAETESYAYPRETFEDLPQIPTTKSEIEQVLESIARSVEQISKIEIVEVIENINKTVTDLDNKINELDVKGISDKTNQTLTKMEKAIENIDNMLTDDQVKQAITNLSETAAELKEITAAIDEKKISEAIENASATMAKANDTMDKADGAIENIGVAAGNIGKLTDPRSATLLRFSRALASIEEASKSIEELTEYLKRNPNAILSGKKRP